MSRNDKIFIIITLVLLAILVTKSLFLDEVKNLTEDEVKLKQFVEKAVEENYDGPLQRNNIITYRVIKLQKTSDEGVSKIAYYNAGTKRYEEGEIQGAYKAKVRGYFLQVIPYKEFYLTSREEK